MYRMINNFSYYVMRFDMLMCIFLYGIVSNGMTVAEHLPVVAFVQLLCVPC